MPTVNDFLPFATGGGANVISQAAYAALPALPGGFVSGIAESNQVNKVLRQTSFVSAALMQFVANTLSINTPDDGNFSAAVTNITSAIQSAIAGSSGVMVLAPTSFNIFAADSRKLYVSTASIAVGLPSPGTLTSTWRVDFYAYQGAIVLIPGSGGNLNGTTSNLTIPLGFSGTLGCDGTNFYFSNDLVGISAAISAAIASAVVAATTSVAGITKYAGNTDVIGNTSGFLSSALAVTPNSLLPGGNPATSAVGAIKLFGTYMIQWGVASAIPNLTNVAVTFPTAFVHGVGFGSYSGSAPDSVGDAMQVITARSVSGMTIRNTSSIMQDLNWLAIGC